jgi:hypothetical protein
MALRRPAVSRRNRVRTLIAMSGMLPTPPTIPLWARWALSFAVAAALLVGLVVFVDHNNNPNSLASQNPAAVVRANREAETLVAQDQSPRVAAAGGFGPRAALERAVHADMAQRVQSGQIDGPLQGVRCAGDGSGPAFSCTAMAAGVNYDYLGVVDVHARRVTFCRRDPPPVPSQNIPVSRRCLG